MDISNGYLHLPVREVPTVAENNTSVESITATPSVTHTVNNTTIMLVSTKIKVFIAGLGNNMTRKKVPSDKEADYIFINDLEEQVFDLVGKVRLDKSGGTTGHIVLVMTPEDFDLIPDTTPFTQEAYLGVVDYLLPIKYTTIQQHTERRCKHKEKVHVFKMKQRIDKKMKGHVLLCFDKDIYVDLRQPRIGYTNITTVEVFKYLFH